MSAVRETYEEAGLLIGHKGDFTTTRHDWKGFEQHGIRPSLEALRFVARAITPPGRVRRFDTRFLACWRDAAALELPEGGPTDELEEIVWLPLAEAREADIPSITRTILEEVERRLADDPLLRAGGPVPFIACSTIDSCAQFSEFRCGIELVQRRKTWSSCLRRPRRA
jgi:8-oxo-dGTP pyrophosphatase MutT (NUDIX family)